MKKYSRWILILSALLCLCMLFVSCQTGDPVVTEPETEPQDTEKGTEAATTPPLAEEPIPSNEKVDYKKLVDKWSEYLEYKAPEYEDTVITKDKILELKGSENVDPYGYGFYVITETKDVTVGMDEEQKTIRTMEYKVYNLYTGAKIGQTLKNSKVKKYGESDFSFDDTIAHEIYSFDAVGCVLELAVYSWVPPTEEASGYYDESYYYFDSTGAALNDEALEERQEIVAGFRGFGEGTVSVLDRAYYIRNEEIVKTFKAGQEILLPVMDEVYKDRGYVFDDSGSVYVYNAENEKVAEFEIAGDPDSSEFNILANGNVLITYVYGLPADAEEYTVELYGEKHKLEYFVLDVTTGKTIEVAPTFIIESLVTPQGDGGKDLAPKGEYQYASVYKITDGKADEQLSYLILDNELKISAELPKILKDQTDIYGALNENAWVIETDAEWLYTVNVKTGDVALHANLYGYTDLEGGFICNNALYNYKLEKLLDFNDYVDRTWVGGRIFVRESYETDGWKMIGINGGDLVTVYFETLPYYSGTGGIERFCTETAWYTMEGEWIIGGEYISVIKYISDGLVVAVDVDGVQTYYTIRNEKGR